MEADLSRYYQTDLRDLYRRDADGVRRLTLRMLLVRVKYLPAESALAAGWSRTDHLLDELRRQTAAAAGVKNPKPHPDRPKSQKHRRVDTPARRKAVREFHRRAAARKQAIAEGRL